jgi:hypothetical protein
VYTSCNLKLFAFALDMSSPILPQQLGDYNDRVVEPALAIIRNRLLQDRPTNVLEYISLHYFQIHSEIAAAASSSTVSEEAPCPPSCSTTSATASCKSSVSSSLADLIILFLDSYF